MLSSTRGALYRMAAAKRLTEMVLPTVECVGWKGRDDRTYNFKIDTHTHKHTNKKTSHLRGVEIRISCDRFCHPLSCSSL